MSNKKLNIFILVFSLIGIVFLLTLYVIVPKLTLDTKKVDVKVFGEYTPIGYKATYLGNDVTSEVNVSGEVDTQHVGKYKVTYRLKKGLLSVRKYLTVNVIDEDAPQLELIGDEELKVCSIKNYIEPGYSSIDNYDGDITNDVVKEYIKDDIIEYISKDSSDNVSKVTRKLVEVDDQKPEIKLNGNATIYLSVGAKYEEKGASASDNCDEDLSDKIVTEGSVDTSKAGTYTIKYSVKDSAGNETIVERKVVVSEVRVVQDTNYNNTTGVIYLTFDDGPSAYTSQILNTLAKYNIKATFFVTMSGSDDAILREFNEGHTVALHTATHNYKQMYASVDAYFEDLNRVSDRVKRITGVESKFIRFPGGTSNHVAKVGMRTLVNEVTARGYQYFDWNVSVEDAGGCAYESDKQGCVINNFKTYLKPNRSNIVLMHDIKSYTAAGLETMIQYAISKNFTFKAIDASTTPVHFSPWN